MQGLLGRIVNATQSGSISAMEFDALVAQSKTYVEELFGADSWQLRHIASLSSIHAMGDLSVLPEKLVEKLYAIAMSIAGMNNGRMEAQVARQESARVSAGSGKFDQQSVFVVHGHDHNALSNVVGFVREKGLSPVVLKDEPNSGQTLLEKFLSNSQVGFAIIMLTPDDMGGAKHEASQASRARQNVVLELGYFIGAIGRDRVAVLYVEGVELPSDIVGLAYIPFDDDGIWKQGLEVEFSAAGYL